MEVSLGAVLQGLEGVEAVEPFRTIPIRLGAQPTFLQGVSSMERLRHGGLPMVEGDFDVASKALSAGTGVLLSENLAYRLNLHLGDTIEIPTINGSRTFRIEGTYVDYLGSLDLGAVMVEQGYLSLLWGDRFANLFRVWIKPGADRGSVGAAIRKRLARDRLGGRDEHFVLEAGDFLESIRQVISRFFAATWALEFVAALVGVIGVINTQLATVLDRAAEIGVLRTIGLSRKDIIRSVVLECGALGALGGVLGVVLGLILGAQIVLVSLRLVTGWSMAFHVPWAQLGVAVLIATVVSALAGYIPARAAARFGVGQRSLD
jgi:putative ABC transport system permease protein